ncbi:NAD(P)/FAD-dependent oxidoreductase [Candidatus Parcubacteria bacterium]|nr:NAD(P)/FAD-dependent oxidoreductase [Candidatus Parcubacteria bacterium]
MPKLPTYDVVIIGTGSAGFSAAEAARAQGASVCVIEMDRLGGECPNDACVPSKALLKVAQAYRLAQQARTFGVHTGPVSFSFAEVGKYRQGVVETFTGGGAFGDQYLASFHLLDVEVKKGRAQFVAEDTVEVAGEHVRGRAFVIATGTTDFIPPIHGIDRVKTLSWRDALRLGHVPKSLAIIGGGPVGCELATFFASFGTRVVLFQRVPQILRREDPEISALAREALEALKVEVFTSASVTDVQSGGAGVVGVQAEVGGNRKMHAVEQVIVAAGKRANTKGLGLDEVEVKTDERGWIVTSREQRTSAAQVFAAGDVDGGKMFTHTAHHEGFVAGYNAALFAKKKRSARMKSDERVVPRTTFLAPEVASVGMTQPEAAAEYKKALIGRCQMATLGRSVTDHARFGLMKIVAHPKTRKVLGGHMIGERAGEVIHEVALAMHVGATVDKLATMIHAYPTFSEAVAVAASGMQLE